MASDEPVSSKRRAGRGSSYIIPLDTSPPRTKKSADYGQKPVLNEKVSNNICDDENDACRHLNETDDVGGERDYFQTRENFQRTSLRYLEMHRSSTEKFLARHRAAYQMNQPPTEKPISNQTAKVKNEGKAQQLSRAGLYRSNSNLEMDCVEYSDEDVSKTVVSSRREYGSTSSLDTIPTNHEGFFDMVRDYKLRNADQRSPAPPKFHEVLRGKAMPEKLTPSSHGGMKSECLSSEKDSESTQSPKLKTKFKHKDRKVRAKSITGEAGSGIFRKLRGAKVDGSDMGMKTSDVSDGFDSRNEERIMRKAFVHFDCQSIGINVYDLIDKRNNATERKNTTTGASAASVNRNSYTGDKDNSELCAEQDEGDNKSNNLVLSCPFFRNELGGEECRNISLCKVTAQKRNKLPSNKEIEHGVIYRNSICTGISVLDSSLNSSGQSLPSFVKHKDFIIEYVDYGAYYYRHFFNGTDHQNYFGIDENLGPTAISIKREKTDGRENNNGKADYGQFQFRVIFRTSELATLRGSILEDAIPSSSRLSSSRGVPYKDVLEYILPEVNLSCLKQAIPGQKTAEQLLKLDEQRITKSYKVGIMYCKAGQSTEEEMYNNENHGPVFEEFLECIGTRVRLQGFDKYRGQLDNKMDSTGTHSIYATFNDYEIMFHVSTLLPFTPSNRQQLLRKRHIGNDIVSIVFQEPGALPFTPKSVRSHFQHVFIIVQAHNPNTPQVSYSVAVSRCKDVPPFGPSIPEKPFAKGPEFTDFLFAKLINGENAAHKSEKFKAMAGRTHQEYLRDLALNYVTTTALDSSSKLSKFALGSGRKKERSKQKVVPDLFAKGATVFPVKVEDFGLANRIDCIFGIAAENIVLIEESTKDVIFSVPCTKVLGWTAFTTSLKLYHSQGECVEIMPSSGESDEVLEIVSCLSAVTLGCQTQEMTLKRNGLGQLGFHIQAEGIVTDVEHYGFAWDAGIRKGTRLVEICKIATITMTHEQIVDLLRTSSTVKVVAIPPDANGNPRSDVKSSPGQIRTPEKCEAGPTEISGEMTSSVKLAENKENRWSKDSLEHSQHLKDGVHSRSNSQDSGDRSLSGSKEKSNASNTTNQRSHMPISKLVQHFESNCKEDTSAISSSGGSYSSPSEKDKLSSHSLSASSNSPVSVKSAAVSNSNSMQAIEKQHPYVSSTMSDYVSPGTPQSGNISLELMKQNQNTKYLLRQQRKNSAPERIISSATNFGQGIDVCFTNSSSHGYKSSENFMQLSCQEEMLSGIGSTSRKKMEHLISNSKGRPEGLYKRGQFDTSPASSSCSSSPRSSSKNLSGRSSEESLSSKNRVGNVGIPAVPHTSSSMHAAISNSAVTRTPHHSNTKHAVNTSNLQEDLLRLFNNISTTNPPEDLDKSPEGLYVQAVSTPLQRATSEESLNSSKSSAVPNINVENYATTDLRFSKNAPVRKQVAMIKSEKDPRDRLSPSVRSDKSLVSPPTRRKYSSPSPNSRIPLVGSTASLEWSNLVNVATKAIESTQMKNQKQSSEQVLQAKEKNELLTPQNKDKSMSRTVVSNPQQRIKELEQKVQQTCNDLDKEKQKNSQYESEITKLRAENQRLQDESQTAATELRRFTEWFFNIVDKNCLQQSPTGLSQFMQAGFSEKNIDRPL
ncbi:signal-induced proliferation-associated 1-like protein 2 isoform X2 [Octopus sinensis]|uniref:Signal-induced proliferation-associated 1-like protein 2 isoform X2 n=1 Tax=Octopus sinensis TaxID=2607531 RepID=A0A6P7TC95_9MOLL|nr:signal-induced proliferation-associated 1-like protein 2 isoform X2 [Octopus sinensis]